MSMNQMYFSTPVLPWDRSAEEEKLFRKLALIFGILFVILSIVMAVYPLPPKQREVVQTVPPRLAKLVLERHKPPPPPPPKEEPKKKKPEEEKAKKKEAKPEKKKEAPKKEATKQTARQKAKAAMAVFDSLADLRDTSNMPDIKNVKQKNVTLGAQAAPTERAIIGRNAIGGSGGVSVSHASSGGGGSGTLAGIRTTKVQSPVEDVEKNAEERRGPGGKARRTTEDIQLVFDRNKGAIYSLYRRALRENPSLQGTVVLRIVIQPSGEVTKCEVVSSELHDPALEHRIVLRVKRMNFGRKDVEVWNDTYPISFIPS